MLYDSNCAMEEVFDSEEYFQDLIQRNKLHEKLKVVREKRRRLIETEENEQTQHTSTLLSKIAKNPIQENKENNNSNPASRTENNLGDMKYDCKDSETGTSSGGNLKTDNNVLNQPSTIMKRVNTKLNAERHFSTIDELKHRYHKEKEKQLELLETIRLLRGINKEDFYQDVDSSEEDEDERDAINKKRQNLHIMHKDVIQKGKNMSKHRRGGDLKDYVSATSERNQIGVIHKRGYKNEALKSVKGKRKLKHKSEGDLKGYVVPKSEKSQLIPKHMRKGEFMKDVAPKSKTARIKSKYKTDANCKKEISPRSKDNQEKTLKQEEESNQSGEERELSPIANQCLTPERMASPLAGDISDRCIVSALSSPRQSPDVLDLKSPLKIDVESENPAKLNAKNRVKLDSEKEIKHEKRGNIVKKTRALANLENMQIKPCSIIKTTDCKIDSRWPKGHKHFTKPEVVNLNREKTCYEKKQFPQLSALPSIRPPNTERRKRLEIKLQRKRFEMKIHGKHFEHDIWRQKLMEIAYDHVEYLKKRSLTLFPFQQQNLESIEHLESQRLERKTIQTSKEKLLKNPQGQSVEQIPRPKQQSVIRNQQKQTPLIYNEKVKEVHFQPVVEKIVRTKSGYSSNDQGYNSDENSQQ